MPTRPSGSADRTGATARPAPTPTATAGPFDALGHRFTVGTAVPGLVALLEERLAALRTPGRGGCARYRLDPAPAGPSDRVVLSCDGEPVGDAGRLGHVLAVLQWHVNRRAVAAAGDLVVLHAAGARCGEVGVALPAPMEAGKTTLVAGLLRTGCRYYSDELVAIDPDTLAVRPYPKPLSIDPGSWDVLPDLAPPPRADLPDLAAEQWQVPVHAVPGGAVAAPAPLRVVIAPRYRAGSVTELRAVSRAEMVLLLASATFDFTDAPGWRLDTLGRVAAECACYELVVGSLADAVAAVREACAAAP